MCNKSAQSNLVTGRVAAGLVIAIPEIPISGFPEIPFSPKSRNSGIFQAKIPEIRDFHFLHYLL